MKTNVYRVFDTRESIIRYGVAVYNNGRYTRPMDAEERKLTGCTSVFGSLHYVGTFVNEQQARRYARKHFGYSKIGNAEYNLGGEYEPLT